MKKVLVGIVLLVLFNYLYAQPSLKVDYISELKSKSEFKGSINNPSIDSASILFDDLTIEMRISELNFQTPINLDYNKDVKKYIEYLSTQKSDFLSHSLSLAPYYFPIFESYLDKYQLPLELKYLSVIESGLNPFARSKSGAVGLWQFLLPTAQLLNLKINSFIDERQDPIKSTEAACHYLEYLYNMFNDWQLAIAAYNSGPTVIKNAMQRSGKKTFWEIKPYLSHETQNYVPAFIATVYLMNYAKEHHIQLSDNSIYYHQVDTIMINQPVYFSDLSQKLNIPLDFIKFLNPSYKNNYIPKMTYPVALILPSDKISAFISLKQDIFSHEFPQQAQLNINNTKKAVSYTVKKGDYLTKIAIDFRCSPDNIKKWNNLNSNSLTTGSTILIWTPEDNTNSVIE